MDIFGDRASPCYFLRKNEMIGEDDGQPLVVTFLDLIMISFKGKS